MNQTRNFNKVLQKEDYEYYGVDDLPELFDPENREEVNSIYLKKMNQKPLILKNHFYNLKMLTIRFIFQLFMGFFITN